MSARNKSWRVVDDVAVRAITDDVDAGIQARVILDLCDTARANVYHGFTIAEARELAAALQAAAAFAEQADGDAGGGS